VSICYSAIDPIEPETTTTSRRLFKFSATENESTPEPSPERKPNPEVVTSGKSDFESATGESPAPKPTRRLIDVIGDRLKSIPNQLKPNLKNILREDLKTKQKNITH
jgi:hypothetical protein